ncbi:MAG: ABC transporter substrate-binding protein [Thermomicrobiales bacterium]
MARQHSGLVNRRQVVAGAAGGAAALALATNGVGVAPSSGAASALRAQSSANIPTPREETLVVEQGTNNVWDSFNPFIPNGEAYNYGLSQVARENMFVANFLTGETTPWLGTKYTYNADFTQITLELNPAVKWSDGQPFTAADVEFSENLYLKNPNLNGSSTLIDQVKSVKATDDHTVVYELTRAQPRFHYRFVAGIIADSMRVVPKHIWEKEDVNTFKFNPPVWTGPYKLKQSGSDVLLYAWEKNPDYWNKANLDPAPGYVVYVQQTAVDAAVQAFLAGSVDVTSADYLNQQVIAASDQNTASFQFPDPCPRGIWFNCESPTGLFAKPEGRWAFSYLIDRETIGKTIWQPETTSASFPWADYQGWLKWAPDSVMSKYDMSFDTDKAVELLTKAGATKNGDTMEFNGKPISLRMITPVATSGAEYQIGQTIVQAAQSIGITIDLKSLPGSAFGDAFQTGDWDMTTHWICGMQFDPDQLFTNFHSKYYVPVGQRAVSGGDQACARLNNPEFDKIIDQMDDVNPDEEKNQDLFFQGLDKFMELLPCTPVIQTIYPFMYSTQYWTGWPDPNDMAHATIPANWWGQFLFTIGNLKKAGS